MRSKLKSATTKVVKLEIGRGQTDRLLWSANVYHTGDKIDLGEKVQQKLLLAVEGSIKLFKERHAQLSCMTRTSPTLQPKP